MAGNEQLLSRKEAAHYLQKRRCSISYQTLANLGAKENAGRGPAFFKDGNRTLYDPDDLDAWRRKRLVRVE